jgi:broad specificity phosphatase PhoE
MLRTIILTCLLLASSAPYAAAQATVFLVRHAERADGDGGAPAMKGTDPDLSPAGQERARSLAAMLKDAKITAIYATELKRTQQTAAPLAKVLGLTVTTIQGNDPTKLIASLKAATDNVLVVGHSNTIPDILRGLGVTTPVTIADGEFDNLFIVTTGPTPRLVRLRYR